MNKIIKKSELQNILFSNDLKRTDILKIDSDWDCTEYNILLHRNTPFEYIGSLITKLITFYDLKINFYYSDYDDSLQLNFGRDIYDIHFIWLDYSRYNKTGTCKQILEWLKSRIISLRSKNSSRIIISDDYSGNKLSPELNYGLQNEIGSMPGVNIFCTSKIAEELGDAFLDNRFENIGATRLSNKAIIRFAKLLGLGMIPGTIKNNLKAIVVDLDNTLYEGVLGEDGVDGIQLTDAHIKLQKILLEFYKKGIFLAISSKNKEDDVHELFNNRTDFPLTINNFSAAAIGWYSKSEGIQKIADKLRITPDTFLFVDDNLAEIIDVSYKYPEINFIHNNNINTTNTMLEEGPWSFGLHDDASSQLRAKDLAAIESRERFIENNKYNDYLSDLHTKITININNPEHLQRAIDLSNKTNQFNLSLGRIDQVDGNNWIGKDAHWIITVSLEDDLSNSGIVTSIFIYKDKDSLIIKDLCISCRALGRNLENLMIMAPIFKIAEDYKIDKIIFLYNQGPRNIPAKEWLHGILNQEVNTGANIIEIGNNLEKLSDNNHGVLINWNINE